MGKRVGNAEKNRKLHTLLVEFVGGGRLLEELSRFAGLVLLVSKDAGHEATARELLLSLRDERVSFEFVAGHDLRGDWPWFS